MTTTAYVLVVHGEPTPEGLPTYTALSTHATSQEAVRAIRERVASGAVETDGEVYSVHRRVYPGHEGGITATRVDRPTVKLSGLEPTRKRGARGAAAIEKVKRRVRKGSVNSDTASADFAAGESIASA